MKSDRHLPLNLGVALSFLVLTATISHAASRTWDGSTSTDYNETTNWSGDDVPDSDDSGILDGDGTGETLLTGGIDPGDVNAFNVRNGHIFNIDNAGGTFSVNNNLNLGRGVEADGSTINQLAGTVNLGGMDMSGNETGGTSTYTISGGALNIGSADTLDVGGDGLTGNVGGGSDVSTFAIVGDTATVSVTSDILARASSVFSFTLGATGIDAIDTTGNLAVSSGATLTVDGSSYSGGAATIPLFTYASRTDATEFTSGSISGFGSLVVDVVYDADSIDLVLTSVSGLQINSFTADLLTVDSGDPVTLNWNVQNETSLTLDPGATDVFGTSSIIVNPTTTTTYTLTAGDGSTTVMDTIEITVTPAAPANSISVNFHSDDTDALADHQLEAGETAGLTPLDGSLWNNINVGGSTTNSGATIFADNTPLIDDVGNSAAATISSTLTAGTSGSWFVGYANSVASAKGELSNGISDDNLFNSYLATNTSDNFSLSISGLGTDFTTEGYSLIIYSDSDRRDTGAGSRQSLYTVTPSGGSPVTGFVEDDDGATPVNIFDGTYILSDGVDDGDDYSNYVIISGLNASDFTIEIDSPDGGRGAISGFQIIAGDLGVTLPLVVNSFVVDDYYVQPSDAVILSWDVSNAETLTLDPGNIDVTGLTQYQINPTVTATYTLTASNSEGSADTDLKVSVGPERPNILLCLVDDWGVMDTSEPFSYDSYTDGSPAVVRAFNNFYQTPNMEQLADDGMKFSQAYALPVCSPTRTSIMTGFNGPRHGVTVHLNLYGTYERPTGSNVSTHRSANGWRYRGMEVTDVTLPRLLSEQGYRSIHVGKAHFGARGDVTEDPRAIGFDINLGGSGAGAPGNYIGNPDYSSGSNPVPYIEDYHGSGKWLTEALTEAMSDAIGDAVDDGVPFFAYMSYYAVHSPFTTNPNATGDYTTGWSTSSSQREFATMVEGVDTSLGQLRAYLDSLDPGVAENTLIIFTGDNGSDAPALSNGGQVGGDFSDYPIRGKKANCYEGGYHVPLFVAWAKEDSNNVFQQQLPIIPDTVEHDIVSVVDIPTTILAVADVPHPYMDGVDLSPYLTSTPGTHREQTLLRHQPNGQNSSFFTAYRRDDYKLIYFYYKSAATAFELYDLAVDRDESDNLASTHPELVLEMAREMASALDKGWGAYGALWPTFAIDPATGNPFSGDGDEFRPLNNDHFLIDFSVYGYDLVDSDDDGLEDALEDADGNGLVGANETDSENWDTDGDKTDDFSEIRLNLDPLNSNSFFTTQVTAASASSMTLQWPSASGLSFNILHSDDLTIPVENWPVLINVPADAVEATTSYPIDISG
ncbi:MAG: sulfatase-like hydrolase/transferase, partial [Opitutales bacterium]|nr:sulfatase-like hydrolase/transferase [Opitutales bacterium]